MRTVVNEAEEAMGLNAEVLNCIPSIKSNMHQHDAVGYI